MNTLTLLAISFLVGVISSGVFVYCFLYELKKRGYFQINPSETIPETKIEVTKEERPFQSQV